jgi:hypothetical protein
MNAIILKGAAVRQPPLPQSGPPAKTIAHPCYIPNADTAIIIHIFRTVSVLTFLHSTNLIE